MNVGVERKKSIGCLMKTERTGKNPVDRKHNKYEKQVEYTGAKAVLNLFLLWHIYSHILFGE